MALQKIIMDAVDFVKKQKGKTPACIPPCGNQKAARVFQCATCHIMHCPFPLDCPVQEVWARADEVVTLHCDVPFAIPPNWSITWMFAKDMRTQDLTLFEELQTSEEGPLSLTLWGPVQGTFACRLADLFEPFIRKYFYLNEPYGSVGASPDLADPWTSHRPGQLSPPGDSRCLDSPWGSLTFGSIPEDQLVFCNCFSCIGGGMCK
nr:sperm acrosome membrane-associated protein 6 isoform X3 [Columba livia]XP_021150605.1 sperm acrosome membrane-associated protein 6 isoform X3 [Columba livia]